MIKLIRKKTAIIVVILLITVFLFSTVILKSDFSQASSKCSYQVLVDVEISKLYVFKDGRLYKEYVCSGGKVSTPSPIGTWTIVSKGKWGEGFGGSWMRI